jgi:hypothetical protein
MLQPPTRADLQALAPLVRELRGLQRRCKPFGADYDALAVALAALDETAETITGEARFFRAGDPVGR